MFVKNRFRYLSLVALLLLLAGCFPEAAPASQSCRYMASVIRIKDGDTFVLLRDGTRQTVRLAHVDCPEKGQAFGNAAKQYASRLCLGKIVCVQTDGKLDRYKRLIATLVVDDTLNINKELVRAGYAWHYVKYSVDESYDRLETLARTRKAGLWSDSGATAPWQWRKDRRAYEAK